MKRLLFFCVWICAVCLRAAVPTFESFSTDQFQTNNLRVFYRSAWTNDAGIVYEALPNSLTLVTNENIYGTFSLPSKVTLLTLGTNQLDMATASTWLLNSPTNDATQVILSLSAGAYQGQLAFITSQNGSNSFTLPDLSEQWDVPGAYVDIQGDWVGTTNRGIILQYTAPDWIEMARFDPGQTGGGTVFGSGTANFFPYWLNASTLSSFSPLIRLSTNSVGLNSTTNILTTSGSHLIYTNASIGSVFFQVKSAAAATSKASFGVSSGAQTIVQADVGRSVVLNPNNGSQSVEVSSSYIAPISGILDLGVGGAQWRDAYISNHIVWNGPTNSVHDLAGSGSPEGVITASLGSLYRDYANGTFYGKTNGVGNTGWGVLNAGAAGSGTTINPTDGFIPYRFNSTTFSDSPMQRIDDNTLLVGVATTNQVELTFTNATGSLRLFADTNNVAHLTGANVDLDSTAGSARILSSASIYNFNAHIFTPGVSNTFLLGTDLFPWKEVHVGTNSLYLGTNSYSDNGTGLLRNGIAVGGAGSALWTSAGGVLEPSPAVDLVRIESQLADNATNGVFFVDTANLFTQGLLAKFSNKGTNAISFDYDGSMLIGRIADTYYGPLSNGETILSLRDIASGDPDNNSIDLYTFQDAFNASQLYGEAKLKATTSSSRIDLTILTADESHNVFAQATPTSTSLSFYNYPIGGDGLVWYVTSTTNTFLEEVTYNSVPVMRLSPSTAVEAYLWGTSATVTSGVIEATANNGTNVFEVYWDGEIASTGPANFGEVNVFPSGTILTAQNGGTNKFTVDWQGSITAGSTNRLQTGPVVTGASVALTTTNYLELTINGVVKKVALVQ